MEGATARSLHCPRWLELAPHDNQDRRRTTMGIRDWPQGERPRDRLLAHGATVLSDAELVALLLRTGIAGRNALDLARDLLVRFRGLAGLFAASAAELGSVRGVGNAKYAEIAAAVELAKRALAEDAAERDALTSPQAVRDYLRLLLAARPHEVFVGLYLDSQNRLLAAEELFRGTLAQTSVYPREVVKAALARNAAAMIFAHNHPSGLAEPSRADELLTQALKQALSLVDIRTLDHFVVAGGRLTSFAERGLL
jgi:DNA repair protein RadC